MPEPPSALPAAPRGDPDRDVDHYLRRDLRERVRRDPELLERILDVALDGFWYWDLEHPEHNFQSPALCRLLGLDPAEVRHLASEWRALILPDDILSARANMQRHYADPSVPYDQYVRYHHQDGRVVWVRCRGLAIRDGNGKPIRMLAAQTDVTVLKDTQEALGRWAAVVAHAGWGIVIGSPDAKTLLEMNPEFVRMHGYDSAEELKGRSILDVFAPESHGDMAEAIRQCHEFGKYTGDSIHIRKDGTRFPVSMNVSVVRDSLGAPAYRVVQVQDISERVLHLAALRDASLSRDVLDGLLEGCQVIGFDYRYLYLNPLVALQAKRSRDDLIGKTMMECFPGIDQTPLFAVLRRCMEERVPQAMENDFETDDGVRSAFDLRFLPVPQGVCILSLDVSARRSRLAAIVEDSDDAIIGRALDGTVTSWNKSAERIFGHTAAEMIGRGVAAMMPPDLLSEEAQLRARVAAGERIDHFDALRLRKDGTPIEMSLTLSPIRDAAGVTVGVSTIARDITEVKRMQRELMRAKEATEAANKELESFSYSVAHDLRAPLRSIDGFSQALLEDYAQVLDADGQKFLGYLRQAAQRMGQLIDDLLDLSRVTRADVSRWPVDLAGMAKQVRRTLERAEPARRVTWVIPDELVADGDPRLLEIVCENLLGNAWKFTSKKATACIEIGRAADGAFFVRDDGAGFDMAYADKLFGVFQRLHQANEFEGTGVGLAIVQRVVHRHGGRVWAVGEVDRGATVYFTLGAGAGGP
ncbi:MAG: PAS domain S-box protein [Myxococcota bacterium]